jgi:hypothetical protein
MMRRPSASFHAGGKEVSYFILSRFAIFEPAETTSQVADSVSARRRNMIF